jgi:putative DNA primase/helicase
MTMKVLTQRNPLNNAEPMGIARAILRARWTTPQGRVGLWEWRGEPWEWYAGKWVRRDDRWLEEALWLAMEDAHVQTPTQTGVVVRRLGPTTQTVMNVAGALRALIRLKQSYAPAWLGPVGQGPELSRCVAFEDVVVDALTGQTMVRDELFFEPVVAHCAWDPGAVCPVWRGCLDQWSGGDEKWVKLLQRAMGAMLMPGRQWQRWLLMQGRVRGGKGTIMRVVKNLVGDGFRGLSMAQLASQFGLWGAEAARVLSVSEFGALNSRESELAVANMKNIVGGDPVTIDRKYMEPIRDVVLPGFLVVQSNEVPRLPNRGQGLASKMLVLPFTNSFLGKEDLNLGEKLGQETAGIAVWAMEGARELLECGVSGDLWPVPTLAEEVMGRFQSLNNPVQDFLEAHYEENGSGFVSTTNLWGMWKQWKVKVGYREDLSQAQLVHRVVEESSWKLTRARLGEDRIRGVKGLVGRSE